MQYDKLLEMANLCILTILSSTTNLRRNSSTNSSLIWLSYARIRRLMSDTIKDCACTTLIEYYLPYGLRREGSRGAIVLAASYRALPVGPRPV